MKSRVAISLEHYATLVDFEITLGDCCPVDAGYPARDVGRQSSGVKSYRTSFDIPGGARARGRRFRREKCLTHGTGVPFNEPLTHPSPLGLFMANASPTPSPK